MHVGYVSDKNPMDPTAWSGGHYSMFRALQRCASSVSHIGRSSLSLSDQMHFLPGRLRHMLFGQLHSTNLTDERCLRAVARSFERDLKSKCPDVLFAPLAPFSELQTDLPLVYCSDMTFALQNGYYGSTASYSPEVCATLNEGERRRIARADLLVYPSTWAAQSAVSDYGAQPEKVRVIPFGANIPDHFPGVEAVLASRGLPDGICRLLFVGRDWTRKGGDLAAEAARYLIEKGVNVSLTVVGTTPPFDPPDWMHVIPYLNKNRHHHRKTYINLLLNSTFMVVPSRAEAYGFVFCEAAAYALPVISTATGGIPSVVCSDHTGTLLPLDADGSDYGRAIYETLHTKGEHDKMASAARLRYETVLNWSTWGEAVHGEIRELRRMYAAPT